MAEGEADDRTEAATPKRLQTARDEGRVPLSREATMLASLGAGVVMLMLLGPDLSQGLALRLRAFLATAGRADALGPVLALHQAMMAALLAAAPLGAVVMVAAAVATLLQTGMALNASALMPDLARLDPRRGLHRVASFNNLVEALKALVKLAVMGGLAWHMASGRLAALAEAPLWAPAILLGRLLQAMTRLALALLATQGVIAGCDVVWVRLRHGRGLRMSRDELKEEMKETDGNPHVKSRLRQVRTARARRRMMAAVPKAAVVVTNPTHYAVALAYDRSKNAAPRVVAKGVDDVAARIREMAQTHKVPLVANPPLARALYPLVLDAEIPAEHYRAVAEIIAYVWKLRGRARGA